MRPRIASKWPLLQESVVQLWGCFAEPHGNQSPVRRGKVRIRVSLALCPRRDWPPLQCGGMLSSEGGHSPETDLRQSRTVSSHTLRQARLRSVLVCPESCSGWALRQGAHMGSSSARARKLVHPAAPSSHLRLHQRPAWDQNPRSSPPPGSRPQLRLPGAGEHL